VLTQRYSDAAQKLENHVRHRIDFVRFCSLGLLIIVCAGATTFGQNAKGIISGHVVDAVSAVLQGAQIKIDPIDRQVISDGQGNFLIPDLDPGTYEVEVKFVGFKDFDTKVSVAAGQIAHVDAIMRVASSSEQVEVYSERLHGEADAINRERTSPNILNVLTSDVITSLPNANIADAVGRLPGVTLERDEGEGKYVQIRGTEPRLSNTTIDGVNVPSPEGGVRQVKLDTIPSDLVESVEINKTLSANQDGDAIGGSVNLVTKTAGERPTVTMFGEGGYTPIFNGRHVSDYGITMGKRFLADKKLGILGGFTYDYNGRGIDDIEPSPTPDSLTPHYDSIDLREYRYDRTRWGTAGEIDYKLSEGSGLYVRAFYSDFKDYGDKWVYTLNDFDVPSYSTEKRQPDYGIGNVVLGGKHLFQNSWLTYELAVARGRQAAAAGNPGAQFQYDPNSPFYPLLQTTCYNDQSLAMSKYRPAWSQGCGDSKSSPVYDMTQWDLANYSTTQGQTTQLNLQAAASYALNYHLGSRFSTFELGFKIRNQHKGQFAYSPEYDYNGTATASQFLENLHNNHYYDGTYVFGPLVNYDTIVAYGRANAALFTVDDAVTHLNSDASNFNLNERITAGYLMNTVEFGKLRLQTGLRFEATNVSGTGYQVTINPDGSYGGTTPVNSSGSYLDPLPSVQARYAITPNTAIRAVYGRGISRPNPQDIIPSITFDTSTNPPTFSLGNPNLRAEHANDFDLLYEQYLNPLGLIQAGFFYKDLGDPLVVLSHFTSTPPVTEPGSYPSYKVTQPANAGSAYVTGFEIAYQQHLSFLPGYFGGLGFSGNYSYTASQAKNVDPLRTDSPALLRQAPNTWNISPTYDHGRFSLRLGLAYNGANIYAYQYENLQYVTDVNGNQTSTLIPNPQVGGTKGPAGDNYLYAHLQVDAQINYLLPKGFTVYVSGLNLSNEVFGFYNGSSQYVVQREYYHPTYSFGVRWTPRNEK
jgi:TonB-dependent receptor